MDRTTAEPTKTSKGAFDSLIVSACGAASSAATAVVLALIAHYSGFAIYSFSIWFVFPVGAVAAGFLAAGGYFYGAKLVGHRPSRLILFNVLAVSVATFFLINYLEYFLLEVEGRRVKDLVSFLEFLQISTEHTTLTVNVTHATHSATGELGSWGYAYAALQILGFAIGGWLVYIVLCQQPYCDKCEKYLAAQSKSLRYSGDAEAFRSLVELVSNAFTSGAFATAIEAQAQFGEKKPSKETHLCLDSQIRVCKSCGVHWFQVKAKQASGDNWNDIHGLTFTQFTDTPISLRTSTTA